MTIFDLVKILLSYILLFVSCSFVHAQQNDSMYKAHRKDSIQAKKAVRKAIYGNARKATIMSACLPGLGQIYNRKYWKAPIIYAALGGLGYWGVTNQIKYKYYSNNLKSQVTYSVNATPYKNIDDLVTQKKYYQKYRDISIMLGALVYLVNIIDANVDAHLRTFDVSDDLSLQLNPYSNLDYNNKLQAGLSVKLKFK